MKFILSPLYLLITAQLTACAVGPDYEIPKSVIPDTYKELAGFKQAEPAEAFSNDQWWELFKDQQLNALEAQVNTGNKSIAQAE